MSFIMLLSHRGLNNIQISIPLSHQGLKRTKPWSPDANCKQLEPSGLKVSKPQTLGLKRAQSSNPPKGHRVIRTVWPGVGLYGPVWGCGVQK